MILAVCCFYGIIHFVDIFQCIGINRWQQSRKSFWLWTLKGSCGFHSFLRHRLTVKPQVDQASSKLTKTHLSSHLECWNCAITLGSMIPSLNMAVHLFSFHDCLAGTLSEFSQITNSRFLWFSLLVSLSYFIHLCPCLHHNLVLPCCGILLPTLFSYLR